VLDNFEQVVEWAPETVGAWMRRAPEAVFLVTSRRPLGLEGERLLPLSPLGLPREGQDPEESEAAQLFLERARAARPGLALDEEAMEDLRVVLQALDGLPLALELAAARMRVLSVTQIRERLGERFRLLAGSRRDHSDRQATLRGAIDWSWELLTEWEKSALVQCSQFRGGFGLEDAEAVLDLSPWPDAPWAMDAVEALVDHSLLRLVEEDETGSRLDMLLSIREYAAEKLETADAVALRHARHFAALGAEEALQKLKGPEGLAARWRTSSGALNLRCHCRRRKPP
jgi:predicted ATPase